MTNERERETCLSLKKKTMMVTVLRDKRKRDCLKEAMID